MTLTSSLGPFQLLATMPSGCGEGRVSMQVEIPYFSVAAQESVSHLGIRPLVSRLRQDVMGREQMRKHEVDLVSSLQCLPFQP